MKNKKLSDLSIEELIKKHKFTKTIAIAFFTIWILVIFIFIGLNIYKDLPFAINTPIIILPVTMLPIFINYMNLNNELKSRNNKEK